MDFPFPAALNWLAIIKHFMVKKNVIKKLEAGVSGGRHNSLLDNSSHLLGYISSVIIALKYIGGRWGIPVSDRPHSPVEMVDKVIDWAEEYEEDSGGEDSDDESGLDGKLCTYIQMARVFMNQH